VKRQVYCPNCGHVSIEQYANNSRAADFFCGVCKEDYELKSQKNRFSLRVCHRLRRPAGDETAAATVV
jgi:type II restriction enzyme